MTRLATIASALLLVAAVGLAERPAAAQQPVMSARAEWLAAMELQLVAPPRATSIIATVGALLHLLLEPPAAFDAGGHLLAGAKHFRASRFEAALVEFRLIERAGSPPPDLGLYLGPTLYKLGRLAEAIEAFATLPASSSEPLADYYHGLAAYDLKLYRRAREQFARVAKDGGPKLGGSAARFIAEIDRVFAKPVSAGTVDAYLEWARQARTLKRPVLVRVYLEEARALSALAGGVRAAEIQAAQNAR